MTKRIDLDVLEDATAKVFAHLRERGATSVEMTEDYYWEVVPEQWCEPSKRPDSLTLGQLSNDLSEIEQIARGDKEPIGYVLVWLAALFRYYGERNIA